MAYQTGTQIVKALNFENRGSDSQFAAAVVAASDMDPPPAVLSLSLVNFTDNATNRAAIGYARDRGIIVIACAGNGGIGDADVTYPGRDERVIAIGATAKNGERGHFSGTGAALDFVAPGVDIVALRPGYQGGGHVVISGCSFATPIAAGIAALMLAVDATLTQQEIYDVWVATARDQIAPDDPQGRDDGYGFGLLDAASAVRYVQAWPAGRFGDPTCDGRTDAIDALVIAQFTVGTRTDEGKCPLGEGPMSLHATPGDVNGDGITNVVDALIISHCVVGNQFDECQSLGQRLLGPS